MNKKAFTLIELLVVISIIALLMSILMPSLGKAKKIAQNVICKTNIKNYGIAGNVYMSDNGEKFPNPWNSIYDSSKAGGRDSMTFPDELQRYCRWHNSDYSLEKHPEYAGPFWAYLQNEKVNLCPIFKRLAKRRGIEHPQHDQSIGVEPQFGYSQNAFLGSTVFGGVLRSSNVLSTSRTFFFAEENMWTINMSASGGTFSENISSAALNDTALVTRKNPQNESEYNDAFATFHSPKDGDHNLGSSNAVMMDGSVQVVEPFSDGTFRNAWPKSL